MNKWNPELLSKHDLRPFDAAFRKFYFGSSERGGTRFGVEYIATARISGRAYSGYHKRSLFCFRKSDIVAVAKISRTRRTNAITQRTSERCFALAPLDFSSFTVKKFQKS
jgi:hypothetical protein